MLGQKFLRTYLRLDANDLILSANFPYNEKIIAISMADNLLS